MTRGGRFGPADDPATLPDDALRTLLIGDPERGWHAFVEQHSPTLLALIERSGVSDRDAAAELYVRICERLAADDCRKLRRFDPARGPLAAWLTGVVRNAVVDWLRAERGRRRHFAAIERLDGFARRVFELYYWEQATVSETTARLAGERPEETVDVARVLDALTRIDEALSDRQRVELLSQLARERAARGHQPLEEIAPPAAPGDDPERAAAVREIEARLAAALAELPAEDAAILRLTFVQGWSRAVVQRALRLPELAPARIRRILDALRERLAAAGVGAAEAATPGLRFLEDDAR
jgi:RNA polymerase sigma factor (sigma-70 family)